MRKAIVAVILIGLVVVSLLTYFLIWRTHPLEVEVTRVKKGEVKDVVTASGKIEADQLVPVVSQFPDKVVEVLVKEGDEVEKDQVLLKLDQTGEVKSPVSGKIVKLEVKEDQIVAAGTSLVTIADMNPTYVVANVDETDISKVKVGQDVEINLDAYPKKKLTGEVTEVGLVATATATGGTAFPVKIKITSSTEGIVLRVGMSADADIILARYPGVIVVPVEAVVTRDGRDIAFVIKNSRVFKREVKLGLLAGEVYEVKKGLKVGEKVIVKDLDKFKGGERVKIKIEK